MSTDKTLRVRPVPGRLYPDHAAHDAGILRYVGWRFDADAGDEGSGGFVMQDAVVDLHTTFRTRGANGRPTAKSLETEYLQALRDGDLEPADRATADLAGVPFTQRKR